MPGDWNQIIENALLERQNNGTYRRRESVRIIDATHVEVDGKRCVNFASNNYLGLTHHPRVVAALISATKSFGAGSGAAALVTGYSDAHASAERAIANWKGTEAAVILSSGYAANLAAIQTITTIAGRGGVRFLLDKLAHASLIDAVRAGGADFRIFPHNHLEKLCRLLDEADPAQIQVVITESIFSMDGDTADLPGLARLKKDRPFVLLLDEAHGSGVYGPNGSGYAGECGLQSLADITVVTLSKALGVSGGAICASQSFCNAIVNFGRSWIYSTNIPPALAAATEAAIQVMHDEPDRQHRVRDMAKQFRSNLAQEGFKLPPGDSPIIPVIIGDEDDAMAAAAQLKEAGFLVVAIRPPTVAEAADCASRCPANINLMKSMVC